MNTPQREKEVEDGNSVVAVVGPWRQASTCGEPDYAHIDRGGKLPWATGHAVSQGLETCRGLCIGMQEAVHRYAGGCAYIDEML